MLQVLSVLALVSFLVSVPAYGIEKEQFLEVLEALQNRAKDIEFKFEAKEYRVEKRGGAPEETPYYSSGRVVLAGVPGVKALWEMKFVSEWETDEGKRSEPGVVETSYAFDGNVATHIRWDDRNADERVPLNQAILEGRPTQEITMGDHKYDGLALVASYYMDKGLAQTLRESAGWQLLKQEGSQCLIRYAFRTEQAQNMNVDIIRDVTVDLSRGGAITGIKEYYGTTMEEIATIKTPRAGVSYDEIELKQVTEGVWMPVSARYNAGTWFLKYSFSDVKVNQNVDDSIFRMEFVPGYQVWDKIHNIKFLAGPPKDTALMGELAGSVVEAADAESSDSQLGSLPDTTAAAGPPAPGGLSTAAIWAISVFCAVCVIIAVVVALKLRARK